MEKGYLLTAAAPDLEHGIAPLGPPVPVQPLHCTEDRDQDHPHGKEMKKAKWLSEEALQIAVKRREAKGTGENERYSRTIKQM